MEHTYEIVFVWAAFIENPYQKVIVQEEKKVKKSWRCVPRISLISNAKSSFPLTFYPENFMFSKKYREIWKKTCFFKVSQWSKVVIWEKWKLSVERDYWTKLQKLEYTCNTENIENQHICSIDNNFHELALERICNSVTFSIRSLNSCVFFSSERTSSSIDKRL